MNLDSLSFALSQINYLVDNLTKKTYKQNTREISNLVSSNGVEAERYFLRCLFSHVDLSAEGNNDCLQVQLLIQECGNLLNKPSSVSLVCYALDNSNQKSLKPSADFFKHLRRTLKLTSIQEIVLGLFLLHSTNTELKKLSSQLISQKLPDLIRTYINAETSDRRHIEGGLHDTSPEILHLILNYLTEDKSQSISIGLETRQIFVKILQRDFPREHVPVILAPLLYPNRPDLPMDKINASEPGNMSNYLMDNSLPTLIMEMGCNFCSTLDDCKNNLSQFKINLTPPTVAKIVTMMVRNHKGNLSNYKNDLDKSKGGWNIEIFVRAVKELNPGLSWKEVLSNLDNPNFLIKDRQGFNLLFAGLRMFWDEQLHEFPVEFFYRKWMNADGQYSLISQILKNPEVFSFADYPHRSVSVEILKSVPDNINKEIMTWRSLDLIEILLYLSDRGLYTQVMELFKFPIQHCPDILILGLLQVQVAQSVLRQELLSLLIPMFLDNHPNSAVILHHVWHSDSNNRPILVHAMQEWYLRSENDQLYLTRILDVAQDLKMLSLLLNSHSFPFVIDLACLASRRGYLKLDKWLSDKTVEHGEPFVAACVKFLQKRIPQILRPMKEDFVSNSLITRETLMTMLAVLEICSRRVSQELSDAILSMIANCSLLLNSSNQKQLPPGVLRYRNLDQTFIPMPGGNENFIQNSDFNASVSLASLISNSAGSNTFSAIGSSPNPFTVLPFGPTITHPATPPQVVSSSQQSLLTNQGLNTRLSKLGQVGMEKTQVASLVGEASPQSIPKDVEEEVIGYFQKIYSQSPHPTLTIEEMLEKLSKFADSQNKRDREVFNCMLRYLFEEYRYFPSYPDKELHITAQLFGGIIERGLVGNRTVLGLALQFVLDSLRKPYNTKMYYFGIAALDRFKFRLKECRKFCEQIANIPHFGDFPAHLIEYIEYGLQGQEPPNRPQGPVLPSAIMSILQHNLGQMTIAKTITTSTITTTSTVSKVTTTTSTLPARPSIANATNIDTLLEATEKEEQITAPPESLQEKVAFIFNNLSQLNLTTKSDELRDIVSEEYRPWLAQYLVMKRVSIELNFHGLYSNLLDALKLSDLNRLVLRETYRNIKVLLQSDKGIANFSDRSLLKNLGHWLGLLTLGRNQPILFIDIDVKSLLIEAYYKGQQELHYVVPFVAKVIESCAKSKVFKPTNPWTMALMNLLSELHREQDLKLNLKFEVEVLCKKLDIDVQKLKPTSYLKDPKMLDTLERQLSPPHKKPIERASSVQSQAQSTPQPNVLPLSEEISPAATVAPALPGTPSSVGLISNMPTGPLEPRFNYADVNVSNVTNLAPHITVNSKLPLLQRQPQLKQLIRTAVERAVQEWIHPVIERSVKIAVSTCEHIVKQDFALDPDESRMRLAAHNMIRNLTAGLAMITCRDHMLTSISANLKTAFTNALHSQQQREIGDAVVTTIAEDNMEVACAFIQKAAIEKAIPEIDKRLLSEYELRKLARNEGRKYCDSQVLTFQAERMPEPIRLKVGGVNDQRMVVYDTFARNIPGFLPINDRDTALFMPQPVAIEIGEKDKKIIFFKKLFHLTRNDFDRVENPGVICYPTMWEYLTCSYRTEVFECLKNPRNHKQILQFIRYIKDSHAITPFPASAAAQVSQPSDEVGAIYDKLSSEMEVYLQNALTTPGLTGATNPHIVAIHGLREAILIAKRTRDPTSGLALLQKAVEGLVHGVAQMSAMDHELIIRYRDAHLRVLKALQDPRMYGVQWTNKHIIRCLIETREELRYNMEAVECLIASGLVNSSQLSSLLEIMRGSNDNVTLTEMPSVGLLNRIHSGIMEVRQRDCDDPPGFAEKVELLLREWVHVCTTNTRDVTKSFSMFIQQMSYHGILKADDLITKFFRISTELCINMCYRSLGEFPNSQVVRTKCYHTLDAFVKLVVLLVKHSGDAGSSSTKMNLLNTILGIVTGFLLHDHEVRGTEFHQLPYERIYIMLFLELSQPEPVLEVINYQVLTSYCHVMHLVRPAKAPGFAFAWLELISHRVFLAKILPSNPQEKGCHSMFAQLLIDLFKFLAPFLRNAEMAKPVQTLYKGTLRVLLVLLHDFPEFLCDYHYAFCDVIPSNCIQMRNLILSAFPRNMRLPDPMTPNLRIDVLSEMNLPPRIVPNFASMIAPASFKKDLDSYLKQRSPVTFLSEIRSHLQISNEPGHRYNVSLMNALVVYVGTQAIQHIRSKGLTINITTVASCAHMDIFQNLSVDLDTEGRYLFLNAIVNHLRYPNIHTYYFSCTLLYLFAESNTEAVKEQITRVLLERLIVNRPYPWGLLITFIQLIKNPNYKFWNHEFVHCAPEIENYLSQALRHQDQI